MKKIKLIVASIVLLVVIIMLLPRIFDLFTNDIEPIDDSDLSLKVILVSDEDNAYFDLAKIEDVIYQPKEKAKEIQDMIDGKMWDEELAEEIISNNQEAFDYFYIAVNKQSYKNPFLANPENLNPHAELPSINPGRRMAQISSVKALYLARQAKVEEAIEEALSSVYIGQKIEESQASMIEYLVAKSMKEIGLETIQKIVSSSDLNNHDLIKYASDLNQFYENEDGFISMSKAEYYYYTFNINAIIEGNIDALQSLGWGNEGEYMKINYHFRPNKTKELYAESARYMVENANEYCNRIQSIESKIVIPSSSIGRFLTENITGKLMFYSSEGLSSSSVGKKCNEDTLVSATQALIAIKAYKNDKGDYPNSLEQLVPDYLS